MGESCIITGKDGGGGGGIGSGGRGWRTGQSMRKRWKKKSKGNAEVNGANE